MSADDGALQIEMWCICSVVVGDSLSEHHVHYILIKSWAVSMGAHIEDVNCLADEQLFDRRQGQQPCRRWANQGGRILIGL